MKNEGLPGDSRKTGFHYTLTEEYIKNYKLLSIKEKFQWLQSANEFIQAFQTTEARKKMNKFRKGEL